MRDVAKISEAVSRPGIDPRRFVDLGVVTAVAVDGDGIHADVLLMDGNPETVALASPYAGPGYGLHFPLELDDAVYIAVPDGKYNAGGGIVGRPWDRGAPIPLEISDAPEDVVLVVKPGQSIHIVVSGGGNAVIEARDGGRVELGQAEEPGEPLLPIMTVDDGATWMDALNAAIAQVGATPASIPLIALRTALGGTAPPLPFTPPAPPASPWPSGALNVTARPSKLVP